MGRLSSLLQQLRPSTLSSTFSVSIELLSGWQFFAVWFLSRLVKCVEMQLELQLLWVERGRWGDSSVITGTIAWSRETDALI